MPTEGIELKMPAVKQYMRFINLFVKVSVAAAIIWFIRDKFNLADFTSLVDNPILLLAVPVCWGVNQLITSMRLHTMLLALGYRAPLSDIFQANFSSLFIGNIMPGVVAADVVKFFFIKKHDNSISNTQLAVVLSLDRFFGLVSILFWCSLFTFTIDTSTYTDKIKILLIHLPIILFVALVAGFLVIDAFLRYSRRYRMPSVIQGLANTFNLLLTTKDKGLLLKIMVYNLLAILVLLSGLVAVGGFLQERQSGDARVAMQFFLVPLSLIVAMLPLTPMGIGVVQVSMGGAYTLFGLDSHVGVSVSTLSQIGQLIVSVSIGGPLFLIGNRSKTIMPPSVETRASVTPKKP